MTLIKDTTGETAKRATKKRGTPLTIVEWPKRVPDGLGVSFKDGLWFGLGWGVAITVVLPVILIMIGLVIGCAVFFFGASLAGLAG